MEQNIFLSYPGKGGAKKVSVIIADDQGLFLEALGVMLRQFDFIEVTGEAGNGQEVLELVMKKRPDVVVTDIQMPEMDGVALTRALQEYYPETRVIALTAMEDDSYIVDMLEAGARGYLLKTSRKEKLAEAILSVMTNGTYYCDTTTVKLMKKIAASNAKISLTEDASLLTPTEKQIAELVCQELTTKEIAERMCIGAKTVEKYRNILYEKIGVKNMAGLVLFAVRSGLVKA